MIRNQNWYDRNESRRWPVSDEATGRDDSGAPLPSGILADLKMIFPQSVASRAFLGAVTVTPHLASVVILGTDSVDAPTSIVPLASVSLAKPFEHHRIYPLHPLTDGVAGTIVFGYEGARHRDMVQSYAGRFTLPVQSLLLPSTAEPADMPAVTGIGKTGLQGLQGLVRLRGGPGVEIVRDVRDLGRGEQEVGVIRLRGDLDRYAMAVPESRTCGDPQPVETLGSVRPDCCGNITLVLRGCARPSSVTGESSGAMIDCDLDLEEMCVSPSRLANAEGRLPGEYDDLCEAQSVSSLDEDDVLIVCTTVPDLLEEYDLTEPDVLDTVSGRFRFDDELQATMARSQSVRNIAVAGSVLNSYPGSVMAVLKLHDGIAGTPRNAAVIWASDADGQQFLFAELDHEHKLLRAGATDGCQWWTAAVLPVPWLDLDTQYELELEAHQAMTEACEPVSGKVFVRARVDEYATGLGLVDFSPVSGRAGIMTDRSPAGFTKLEVRA